MTQVKGFRLSLIILCIFSCFFISIKPAKANFVSDWIASIFRIEEATNSYTNAILGEGVAQEKNVSSTWSNSFNFINGSVYGGETVAKLAGITGADKIALEKSLGGGLIGSVNQGIVALYTPPASTRSYVADLMKSAKIIPEAQAQGLGFSALDPILETWKSFRNLAYLFFVVIFMIIGFMIMFRTKVGQAAITAQQAIPNVVIAMLAVTFSYAIAGLMIDIMYVVMYVLAGYFTEGPDIITRNVFGLIGLMFKGTGGATQNAIEQFMEDALNISFVGEAIAWLSSLLGTVIIGIAILFATFKIFFELVKTYVAVLIQIIFSPIILMLGAFPGKDTFGKWLKNLAGNLVLWPVVLLCVLVQRMLTAPIRSLQGTGDALDGAFGGGFMPPFLVGQGQANIIPVILGIGILLVIPEIMQQVKKAMGVEEGVFGQLAGAALKQTKEAVPLGGRIGGAGIGAGLGVPVGVARGLLDKEGRDKGVGIAKSLFQGDFYNAGKGAEELGTHVLSRTKAGIRGGASAGVNLTSRIERKSGINQPDILNPLTSFIDTGDLPWKNSSGKPARMGKFDGLASEEEKKKQSSRRNTEDSLDLLAQYLGGSAKKP